MSRKSADKPLARVPSVSTIHHSFSTSHPLNARVVEWQTRTFEGRMPKGMRVQVPPRALKCGSGWARRAHLAANKIDISCVSPGAWIYENSSRQRRTDVRPFV